MFVGKLQLTLRCNMCVASTQNESYFFEGGFDDVLTNVFNLAFNICITHETVIDVRIDGVCDSPQAFVLTRNMHVQLTQQGVQIHGLGALQSWIHLEQWGLMFLFYLFSSKFNFKVNS